VEEVEEGTPDVVMTQTGTENKKEMHTQRKNSVVFARI
jgi:hypothetical protein